MMRWYSLDEVTDVAWTALDGGEMHQQTLLIFNAEVVWQPMQFKQCWSDMVVWLQSQYNNNNNNNNNTAFI